MEVVETLCHVVQRAVSVAATTTASQTEDTRLYGGRTRHSITARHCCYCYYSVPHLYINNAPMGVRRTFYIPVGTVVCGRFYR